MTGWSSWWTCTVTWSARSRSPTGRAQATWTALTYSRTDEFGNPEPLTGAGAPTGPPARYGWLGAAQRSAEALGGVVLMGVRLYSPVTGRFLSADPVPGGSASAYDYCNADPVDCTDLAGTWSLKGVLNVVAAIGEVASFIPGPVGAAAAAVSAVAYAVNGNTSKALEMGVTAAAALVGAGAVVHAVAGGLAAAKVVSVAAKAGAVVGRAVPKLERAEGAYTAWNSTKKLTSFENAMKHFLKPDHGAGVGAKNLRQYVVRANRFLDSRAPAFTRVRKSDGAFVRWSPITNRLAVRSAAGAPQTYFRARSLREGFLQFRMR